MSRLGILAGALAGVAIIATASADDLAQGKIVKLDPVLGKVTLTHGPIPKLDMPSGMTMSYRVETKAMLDGLKVGDHVRFDARDDGGSYTITKVQK